ncbi:YeeE/YedE family protein [Undibacterium fentianense]|uniref:YeeE/YedE family protein n=1 Tax=Undibacterium fentianense TaxID=2828728 RepID=A0A941E2U9_9BURK|nr:YeeE/YedE family protein [Undibacterium fentianense]MBR7801340.1 YeeE/YedE family protein [Undibacterium fentianense]
MILRTLIAALSGLIFGLGLIIAGMANPAKVLAFLDLAGAWDPSLAFVMAGAIALAILPFLLLKKRRLAWSGDPLRFPKLTRVDRRLVSGSLLFGIGWGIAGICPGPAIVLLGAGIAKAAGFVATMCFGMWLADRISSNENRDDD